MPALWLRLAPSGRLGRRGRRAGAGHVRVVVLAGQGGLGALSPAIITITIIIIIIIIIMKMIIKILIIIIITISHNNNNSNKS